MTPQRKKILFISLLIFCFLLIAAARLYPLIQFGESGLGYDTGFYRRYLEINTDSFIKPPSFILGPETLGARFILSTLSYLGLNANMALFGSYILFSLFLGMAIYLLAGKIFKNRAAGIFALFIFALSPVQWLAFTFFFYKQFIAAPLLILVFYFLETRSLFFILPLFLAFITHRTTAFLAIPSVLISSFLILVKHKKIWIIGLTALAAAFLVWQNWIIIKELLLALINGIPEGDRFQLQTGVFINISHYIKLAFPYFLPAIIGLWLLIKKRYLSPLFFFFLTCLVLVIAKSFFYERIIFYLDICLIIFAGGGLAYLWKNKSHLSSLYKREELPSLTKRGWGRFYPKLLSAALLLFTAVILFFTIKSYLPLISSQDLSEIKKLRETPNESYVITYDSRHAPWIYGWAGSDKRVVAPGLFWNKWNGYQWNEFWLVPLEATSLTGLGGLAKQKKMLAEYQAPLYIFKPDYDYSSDPCFEKFNELVWKFKCYQN